MRLPSHDSGDGLADDREAGRAVADRVGVGGSGNESAGDRGIATDLAGAYPLVASPVNRGDGILLAAVRMVRHFRPSAPVSRRGARISSSADRDQHSDYEAAKQADY